MKYVFIILFLHTPNNYSVSEAIPNMEPFECMAYMNAFNINPLHARDGKFGVCMAVYQGEQDAIQQ